MQTSIGHDQTYLAADSLFVNCRECIRQRYLIGIFGATVIGFSISIKRLVHLGQR